MKCTRGLEKVGERRFKKIEVGGPAINFDYAHFLPSSPKCGVLHGHTSMVNVAVVGEVVDDMVVEFSQLKQTVKKVIDEMDHKLIVASKYIVETSDGSYRIVFKGVGGVYDLRVPKNSVYVIERDSTVENISEHITSRIRERMPPNVYKVVVRMTEGLGKSATSSV
ncbi:MAG: 6-carboxytetrahydropterin synthase [Candidatus Caldarchaeum sp.]|nr:6-carboxytetrahydropterin synthase [Candidatus Caldarchaeum sp.]